MKRSRKFGIGSALKTYSRRFFTPTPKNMSKEKALNLRQLIEYGRQSEAVCMYPHYTVHIRLLCAFNKCTLTDFDFDFETAQHIDKRL